MTMKIKGTMHDAIVNGVNVGEVETELDVDASEFVRAIIQKKGVDYILEHVSRDDAKRFYDLIEPWPEND